VVGAEVEQGRIAVEALAAVEVQVATAAQLSSLDPSQLPQQLILKTTNPILLAYKYVHTDPPYQLALRMTRHREMDVQTAAIDTAEYRTLFTADGLAVTTARFSVRNSRKQFLRVRLPRHAELWSATVDGKPEKPADASDGSDDPDIAPEILIKVINSVQGFPVEIIYTTPASNMHSLGRVTAHLPRPDMVVTRSHWDLYMPDRFHYGTPTTNMNLVSDGTPVSREALEYELSALDLRARKALREPGRHRRLGLDPLHLGLRRDTGPGWRTAGHRPLLVRALVRLAPRGDHRRPPRHRAIGLRAAAAAGSHRLPPDQPGSAAGPVHPRPARGSGLDHPRTPGPGPRRRSGRRAAQLASSALPEIRGELHRTEVERPPGANSALPTPDDS
jgi:hypothetical protein